MRIPVVLHNKTKRKLRYFILFKAEEWLYLSQVPLVISAEAEDPKFHCRKLIWQKIWFTGEYKDMLSLVYKRERDYSHSIRTFAHRHGCWRGENWVQNLNKHIPLLAFTWSDQVGFSKGDCNYLYQLYPRYICSYLYICIIGDLKGTFNHNEKHVLVIWSQVLGTFSIWSSELVSSPEWIGSDIALYEIRS